MYLQLIELTKKFNDQVVAVDNLNLDVESGKLVSILGPSGCGKTTTLNMIGGFIVSTHGSILLEEKDITNTPPYQRPTATVFQNYALFPHMTVLENVIYGLKYQKVIKKEALYRGEKMLEMVDLQNCGNKDVNELSGGEQQRVALARALIVSPKVLLMDEPLSNLDAKLRVKMRRDIKELQARLGITTIYVTHDQEEALSISDKIVVMDRGVVSQVGTPQQIYQNPQNKFVADFIGKANIITNSPDELVIIRPEDIEVSDVAGQWWGKIIQKQFMGALTTYYINVNEHIIQADVLSRDDNNRLPGEQVYITFPKGKIIGF